MKLDNARTIINLKLRNLTVFSLFLIVGIAVACGGGFEGASSRGRSLEIHVPPIEIVEKIAFVDKEGRHRVIKAQASNRQLVLAEITLVNRTSTFTPLFIDSSAAELGDRRGERIEALDPFETADIVETADPEEGKYLPLLWGTISLERDFQVTGWMVFDVPKGMKLGSLWWNQVDEGLVLDF